MSRHLPVWDVFHELDTDLGLSNSSHSPQEARVPWSVTSTMSKNLSQSKYIFLSSKKQIENWILRCRNLLHGPLTRTCGRTHIVLIGNLYIIIAKSFRPATRKTYKSATSDQYILSIRKDSQAKILTTSEKVHKTWCSNLLRDFVLVCWIPSWIGLRHWVRSVMCYNFLSDEPHMLAHYTCQRWKCRTSFWPVVDRSRRLSLQPSYLLRWVWLSGPDHLLAGNGRFCWVWKNTGGY